MLRIVGRYEPDPPEPQAIKEQLSLMNHLWRPEGRGTILKLIIVFVILAIAIACLWFGLKWLDSKDAAEGGQFGDHGDWGSNAEAGEQKLLVLDSEGWVYTDDVKTYLLIGTDATGTINPQKGRGDMADFVMLFLVNRTTNQYGFIQINRDTMTDIPVLDENGKDKGTFLEQLCIAHWYGITEEQRNENTVKAVSMLFGGLDIDGYYTINMDDVSAFNDAIGGVVVSIDEDLTAVDPDFKEGTEVLLTGDQAEAYVRARMSVGKGTNLERMDRQLKYMQAAYNRVINQLREEPNYINTLWDELKDRIQTDQNDNNLGEFAKYISKGTNAGFLALSGESKSGDTLNDGIKHAEFYLNDGTIRNTLTKLMNLIPEPDEIGEDAPDPEDDTDQED